MRTFSIDRLRAVSRELTQGLLQLLYPHVCAACHEFLPPDQGPFCDACRTALTREPHPTCPRCAGSVGPYTSLEEGCSSCRATPFHFERTVRLGPYDDPLREVILRMKHPGNEGLAELVGELWAEYAEGALRGLRADVVVPIPLHWWRRWQRGFNQSEALARAVAARLRLPCRPGWIRRTRHTPPQKALQSPAERRANVQGAFFARPRRGLSGKAVLLVDDVLTSGSTCDEAARVLLQAGAGAVRVAVLARGGK